MYRLIKLHLKHCIYYTFISVLFLFIKIFFYKKELFCVNIIMTKIFIETHANMELLFYSLQFSYHSYTINLLFNVAIIEMNKNIKNTLGILFSYKILNYIFQIFRIGKCSKRTFKIFV